MQRDSAYRSSSELDEGVVLRAWRLVVEHRRGSVSLVQRHLGVSYNKATALLEALQRRGVVGPPDMNGTWAVLVGVAPPEPAVAADVSAREPTGRVREFTLPAGTLCKLGGIPFELVEDTKIRCHAGNDARALSEAVAGQVTRDALRARHGHAEQGESTAAEVRDAA